MEDKEEENRPHRLNAEDVIKFWNLLKPTGIAGTCKVEYDLEKLMKKETGIVAEGMS